MDMRKLVTGTIMLMAIVLYQHTDAASLSDTASNNHLYQVQYDQTSAMPDHMAYLELMQGLTRAENGGGHAANIRLIENHLALDREHAELFLQFMLASYSQMISTNRAITTHMLCNDNKPKYDADHAYEVLDVLDGMKETNLRRTFQRARMNLGSDVAKRLNGWLSVIKLHSSDEDLHHVQAFLHSDQNVEQFLGQACNLVASY